MISKGFAFGFALLLVGLSCPAQAQLPMTGAGKGAPASAAYVGPGNVASGAKVWVGLRGYNTAYTGNVARICDAATGLVCGTVTWGGTSLSFPTIGGVACNNITNICVIDTLYDQSGANYCSGGRCDFTQSTNANRPVLTLNCLGSLPCITNTTNQCLLSAGLSATSQPISFIGFSIRTANFTTTQAFIGASGNSMLFEYLGSVNTFFIFAGGELDGTATDNVWHNFGGLYNGASSKLTVDSTTTTGDASTGSISSSDNLSLGQRADCSQQSLTGQYTEFGMWASDVSSNFSGISSQAHAFWGS